NAGVGLSGGGVIALGGSTTISLVSPVAVGNGGTGATSLSGAINNLLPTQTGNSGTFLTTDGTNVSWSANGSTLTSLNASNLASGTVPVGRLSGTYGINISGNAATAISFTGALAGDVTGAQSATTVGKIQGVAVMN